jgi:NAD(P)-dependent dehydrogenase (short-subunit alcohol dehydrogenase family)
MRRRRVPVPELRGKRCLITGAASGIGRATALLAASRGAELFLTDLQEEALERVVEEVRAAGGVVGHAAPADVADHDSVVSLAAAITAEHGAMDVVMNVAGIATWGTIDRLEHRHWQRVVDVNLMGPISVLECFVPPMIAAGRGGQVVNVSSAAGLFGLPWHAPYSATKFGLRGVSEVLRFDLRRHNIGVSLVCPGAVHTPLTGTVTIVGVDRERPEVRKAIERFERRAVSPEHVAACIVEGIERNRYMVFTSPDIRWGFWLQGKWAKPYEWSMRAANRYFTRVVERR